MYTHLHTDGGRGGVRAAEKQCELKYIIPWEWLTEVLIWKKQIQILKYLAQFLLL